ncbi:GumC family protein [Arthrospira platensis]|uniref:GumC family protein n=1 Tax=Limnospira platensis TaxID=118562 RepID=UPI001684680D|nr:polysaccharide biosynthesis tyrosine autokinase [Arthrospira platensis]MBD2573467.1 polysaccharide biosynthesis tyrosine autokinase [Arthrospira platensis FACHB-971]MBD2710186.1 polysaccharide biosynthesis tyrosine autokinase [Arthrospira platensis FACHB-835]
MDFSNIEHRESIDLDLGRYLQTLKRRWFWLLGVFVLSVSGAVYATQFLTPTYENSGKILFKVDRTSSLAGIGEGLGELKALLADQTPLSTQIELMYSNPLLETVIERLNLTNEDGEPVAPEDIRRNLDMRIIGGTDIVLLTYQSRNPQEVADVINTVMEVYIEANVSSIRQDASGAKEFIQEQLPRVQKELFLAEKSIQDFKERNEIVDLGTEFAISVQEMAQLNRNITTLEAELNAVQSLVNSLGNQVGLNLEEAIAVNTLSQSPVVRAALQELENVEGELAQEQRRFRDENPRIISLKGKRDNLENLLQREIQVYLGSSRPFSRGLLRVMDVKNNKIEEFVNAEIRRLDLTKQLDSLYEARDGLERRARILPQLEQQQQELERKAEVARLTYRTLLQNLEEAQVAANKITNNARIIETANVPDEGKTAKVPLLALGVMGGLVASTTLLLLMEMGDKSLRTVAETRDLFGYTLLGIIPSFAAPPFYRYLTGGDRSSVQVPVVDTPGSLISEIYRMIQANLKFLGSDRKVRVIVVSSSVPQEGKSTVSANLAAAIAQLGHRVILIDGDMRQPIQHHIWGLTNAVGLSDVLVEEATLSEAVKPGIDQLDILTAGVTPPNPLALLDSRRMTSLIRNFSEEYDFVIIDTPPLLLAADALTLANMASGVLMVARPRILDRDSAKAAKEILGRSGQRILGTVINGISKNESTKYFYHAQRYFPLQKSHRRDRSGSPQKISSKNSS